MDRHEFAITMAAIFAGLGATPDEADRALSRLGSQEVATSAGDVMRQCQDALDQIRANDTPGAG